MGMKQQIPWTKYLIPWLTLGLFTSYGASEVSNPNAMRGQVVEVEQTAFS